MLKILSIVIAFIFYFSHITDVQAEDLIPTTNILKHLYSFNKNSPIPLPTGGVNKDEYTRWYRSLSQADKNQALAGAVNFCQPELVEISIKNGGNITTPVYTLKSGAFVENKSPENYKNLKYTDNYSSFIYTSGTREQVWQDAQKRAPEAAFRISVSDRISPHSSSPYGIAKFDSPLSSSYVSLLSQGILSCDEGQKLKMVNLLLKYGANPNIYNEYGESALTHALLFMKEGIFTPEEKEVSRQIFKLLLQNAPTTGWDWEVSSGAVAYALSTGDKEVLDMIKSHNLKFSTKTIAAKESLLMTAFVNTPDNHKLLKDLLQNGIDVNYRDAAGQTALFPAVFGNNVEAAKILLENGIDAEAVDNYGHTAWWFCENLYNENEAVCNVHPLGQKYYAKKNKKQKAYNAPNLL